jgi:hypothetical protein
MRRRGKVDPEDLGNVSLPSFAPMPGLFRSISEEAIEPVSFARWYFKPSGSSSAHPPKG